MTKALGTVTEFLQICGNVYTNKMLKLTRWQMNYNYTVEVIEIITISLNYSIISIFPCNVFTYKQTFLEINLVWHKDRFTW